MRKFKIIFTILLSIACFGCNDQPTDINNETDWEKDINYFATELPKRHPNLFFKLSKQEFNSDIAKLKELHKNIPEYEIIMRLQEILVKVGDSHTRIQYINPADLVDLFNFYCAFKPDFHRLPLQLYWFLDGIYVINATNEYAYLIGKRVTGIGNLQLDQVIERLQKFVFHENESYLKLVVPYAMISAEYLKVAEIIDNRENVSLVFEGAGSVNFSFHLITEQFIWKASSNNLPLYLQNINNYYSYTHLTSNKTLYIHYNICFEMPGKTFSDFEKEVVNILNNNDVEKMIIDLRMNLGGSSIQSSNFINTIKNNPKINKRNNLFVIIGRRTYSSGLQVAQKLKNETNSILLGEPTSLSTIHYGEVQTFALPFSNLLIRYSTKYFNNYYPDNSPSLNPEISVPLSSTDYFNNIDPIYEYIVKNIY